MRPILLIDVDGVLCPYGGTTPVGYLFDEKAGVYISSANGDRLRRLQQSFDLHWGTAWEELANTHLLKHLGLEDPLPVLEFNHKIENNGGPPLVGASRKISGIRIDPSISSWKLPWIRQWAEHIGRPFAWIDDDIWDDAKEWATEWSKTTPAFFLAIDPEVGLTDNHVEELEEWAKSLQTD